MFVDGGYAQTEEYRQFWSALARGEYRTAEYRRIGKGGREIWILASYNPIFGANGKPFKVVKYATDITAQMAARSQSQQLTASMQSTTATVAQAAEEIAESIEEIGRSMKESALSVNDIAGKVRVADELMGSLRETAKSMEAVIDLIRNIAGQVNLLSLNATIEAARAGEAGRGFAVVASEIKSLANQTSKATDDITSKIGALQDLSVQAAESSAAINVTTGAVSSSVTSVAGAMEQHKAATREIAQHMSMASQDVDELNRCIRQLAAIA
jgi:methyl-accepting chemotaxis protein